MTAQHPRKRRNVEPISPASPKRRKISQSNSIRIVTQKIDSTCDLDRILKTKAEVICLQECPKYFSNFEEVKSKFNAHGYIGQSAQSNQDNVRVCTFWRTQYFPQSEFTKIAGANLLVTSLVDSNDKRSIIVNLFSNSVEHSASMQLERTQRVISQYDKTSNDRLIFVGKHFELFPKASSEIFSDILVPDLTMLADTTATSEEGSESSDDESIFADFGGPWQNRDQIPKIKKMIAENRTSGINQICRRVIKEESLSNEDISRMHRGFEQINKIVNVMNMSNNKKKNRYQLAKFGSQKMKLATKKSDLDLVLIRKHGSKKEKPVKVLRRFCGAFSNPKSRKNGLRKVETRFHARVPIVVLNYQGLSCDISVRRGADKSTDRAVEYIKQTLKKHDLVHPFLLLIKEFAKRRRLCDAHRGSINSFGWVNIGIWFLKNKFGADINIHDGFGLGDLFILFFHAFDRVQLSKLALESTTGMTPLKPPSYVGNALVVLDPVSNKLWNLATSCTRSGLNQIKREVRKMVEKTKRLGQFNGNTSFTKLIS